MRWLEAICAMMIGVATCSIALAEDGKTINALDTGRALLRDNKCNGSCHQSYSEDNDPLTLYTRVDRKANNRQELDRMVRKCVASLGSMIFPEEIENVSAALEADYYKFSQPQRGQGR